MNGTGYSQEFVMGMYQERTSARRYYISQVLKAFKLFECKKGKLYTCNVARLHECNRLGEEKEVTLWRTHFFLYSPAFQNVKGVIFSARPGMELATLSRIQVKKIYLADGNNVILDPTNGKRFTLDREIVFASAE